MVALLSLLGSHPSHLGKLRELGALILWKGTRVSLFSFLDDSSITNKSDFSVMWRIKILRKVRFFAWQVLHGHISTPDGLVRKLPLLVGPLCCILYG